jgi:hypothetical protein
MTKIKTLVTTVQKFRNRASRVQFIWNQIIAGGEGTQSSLSLVIRSLKIQKVLHKKLSFFGLYVQSKESPFLNSLIIFRTIVNYSPIIFPLPQLSWITKNLKIHKIILGKY